MSKIYKEKEILFIQSDKPIPFKEYKGVLEDDDIVNSGYDEGHYSENNSWDPFYYVRATRQVLETDEEYEKRIEENRKFKEELKQRRYERYLELKKEFENETIG